MIELTPFLFSYFSFMVFVLGCCLGSFLNVCIYRIPREESVVAPRSHCPHCGKMIAWYDNIPLLSYLVLRARCRHCGGPISIRYFLVEGLVGTLFLLVWFAYGVDARTPVYWMIVSGLVLGTFVDLEYMIIPDRVTLGGIVAGLVLGPLIPSLHGASTAWAGFVAAMVGAAAGSGLLWVVGVVGRWVFKKDAMGFGDVKLLGGVGALMGWHAVLFTVMVSSILGSAVNVFLVATRRKQWQSRVPYGPYLAMATLMWVLWGAKWWDAYAAWVSGAVL
jgi:leader peptidase (prepilin peptidase) / N-methyltransferase